MFERFTDRARKVMQLANQEAQRFNHEYVGTEHVLLGLVKQASGAAAFVLRDLDVDLRRVRLAVEALVQPGPAMLPMGKLPQTPRVKRVLAFAIEEATALSHNYVGTEHLLLGLLREEEGAASDVLKGLGLNLGKVREQLLAILGWPNPKATEAKQAAPETEKQSADLFPLSLDDKVHVIGRRGVEYVGKELEKIGVTMAKVHIKIERA